MLRSNSPFRRSNQAYGSFYKETGTAEETDVPLSLCEQSVDQLSFRSEKSTSPYFITTHLDTMYMLQNNELNCLIMQATTSSFWSYKCKKCFGRRGWSLFLRTRHSHRITPLQKCRREVANRRQMLKDELDQIDQELFETQKEREARIEKQQVWINLCIVAQPDHIVLSPCRRKRKKER